MKLILKIVAIGLLTYFLSPLTFWWIAMLISFVVCASVPSNMLTGFIAGFLGVGLVWAGYTFYLDNNNASVFTGMIAELFPVSGFQMILVAGGIGGLAGGLAGMTGVTFRQLFAKQKQQGYYH